VAGVACVHHIAVGVVVALGDDLLGGRGEELGGALGRRRWPQGQDRSQTAGHEGWGRVDEAGLLVGIRILPALGGKRAARLMAGLGGGGRGAVGASPGVGA
jgi:hypothetical protein